VLHGDDVAADLEVILDEIDARGATS